MSKFVVGDVVRLNSGSTDMTVIQVGVNFGGVAVGASRRGLVKTPDRVRKDYVICQWFEGEKLKSDKYQEDTLTKVERGS